jgi:hypothetical protein
MRITSKDELRLGEKDERQKEMTERETRDSQLTAECVRGMLIVFCYMRLRPIPAMETTKLLFLTITRKQNLQKPSVYSTIDSSCYFTIEDICYIL